MKIALIPPTPDLGRYAAGDGIHLLLSHLFKDSDYWEYYMSRSEMGDYLILDNSAHEHGQGNDMKRLLKEVERVNAHEVVVPDALFDARGTAERARQAIAWLRTPAGECAYNRAGRPRLMYVPQGGERAEWGWCLKQLMKIHASHPELEVPVVGISKDYYYWHRGLAGVIFDYVLPYRTELRIDVHCLGWSTDLWSLAKVAREFPWVRSTDSAKPFVYAKNGILLEPGGIAPPYPRRDKRYFDEPLGVDSELVLRNIEVYRCTATDKLISST